MCRLGRSFLCIKNRWVSVNSCVSEWMISDWDQTHFDLVEVQGEG